MTDRPARTALCAACLAFLFCTAAGPFAAFDPEPPRDSAVGVIVPLSGKWESVGQRILRGVMAAGGVFGQGEASGVRYVVRDYGESEESIPAIIEALERDHSVVAVIGPVGERASEIACREVQRRGLPAVMFTQAEMPAVEGTYCFRNFLTIDMQARALLEAARSMRITRFGILRPDDHFGRTFSETFQRLSPAYGVQVVGSRVYPVQKADYARELRALVSGLKPEAAPEAILIPDSAQNAALIASYIMYLNMRNVRIFGPTLWDSPEFLKVGGRHVDDAVYLSGFFQGSSTVPVQNLIAAYRDAFGSQPSVWDACAYDTARILQSFLHGRRSSRADLRAYLAGVRGFPGASGTTAFRPDGSLEKSIHLLTVRRGVVIEIQP